MSNFVPVLFFFEWELSAENTTSEPTVYIGSGLVKAYTEEGTDPIKLMLRIKEALIDNGYPNEHVANGRLLNICRV
jgi:hypothetical protein